MFFSSLLTAITHAHQRPQSRLHARIVRELHGIDRRMRKFTLSNHRVGIDRERHVYMAGQHNVSGSQ
jgi:hypothetical protein